MNDFVKNEKKNEIRVFENEQFGQVRIAMDENGEPLFCAKDVAEALGYKRPQDAIAQHVETDDSVKHRIVDSMGRNQHTIFINESGLYSLIFASKLENAKKFKHWVTSEVLPSVRKHGAYMTDEVIERTLTDPDYLIKLATQLKMERQKRMEAEEKNKQLTEDNIHKEQVIEGLVSEIPVADMRQRINQILIKDGVSDIRGKWAMLYGEFDRKYHMNVGMRMSNVGYNGTRMDYIDNELHMITELYDLACKLFESSYEQLMESWGKYAKRAKRYNSQS